jgi:hypothetical protein
LVAVWLPPNHQKQNTKNNGIIFLRYFRIRMKKLRQSYFTEHFCEHWNSIGNLKVKGTEKVYRDVTFWKLKEFFLCNN